MFTRSGGQKTPHPCARPARCTIGCKAVRIGRKSFTLRQEVWRQDGTLIADADTVLVALGPDKVMPAEVSADWRSKLSSWEGTTL